MKSSPFDLPTDVLIHTLRFCDLKTSLSITLVNKAAQALSQHRIFWITALRLARAKSPLACSFHEDFSSLDLHSLKCIVLHSLRLDRNWNHPVSFYHGPIKSVPLGDLTLDTIFQIPGTELYLLHSRLLGAITCWDVNLGRPVSSPIRVGSQVLDVSPGYDEPFGFSMALLLKDELFALQTQYSLVIVRVQYDRLLVNVEVTFREHLPSGAYYWAVFLNEEIVGVLRCGLFADSCIDIMAFGKISGQKTNIQSDIPHNIFDENGHSGTSMFDGNLFILKEVDGLSCRYRCPADMLPYNKYPTCPPESRLRAVEGKQFTQIHQWNQGREVGVRYNQEGALSADPFYGIPAVSLHSKVHAGVDECMHIKFWSRSVETLDLIPVLVPICEIDVPGILQSSDHSTWSLILLSHSGRHVLLVVSVEDEPVLQLVRFHEETASASVHRLEIPPFIDLRLVHGLSIDDHRGVVSLLDNRGFLFAIPYA